MQNKYALLSDRVKAAVIDGIVIVAAMFLTSEIFALFEHVPNYVRISAAVLISILYDPIFTSSFGGTIGHTKSNIEVKRDSDNTKNLSFPVAIIRFLLKVTLGWLSLLTTTGNEKRKAIHDIAVNSVVLNIKE
jgi:uncharacterized RDD family membrane protein YckC